MYFSTFDVTAAYYHFAQLDPAPSVQCDRRRLRRHQSAKLGQLDELRYQPGLSDSQLSGLSSNAKDIYQNLVREYVGVHSTVNPEVSNHV